MTDRRYPKVTLQGFVSAPNGATANVRIETYEPIKSDDLLRRVQAAICADEPTSGPIFVECGIAREGQVWRWRVNPSDVWSPPVTDWYTAWAQYAPAAAQAFSEETEKPEDTRRDGCPFCGSKDIQIDPDAAMDTFALAQGPDGGVIMLDGNAKAVQWADLNHAELHFCHGCTAEFDDDDHPSHPSKESA